MSDHKNHRQRLKQRFKDEGLDGFTNYQMLELLLFYSIPRKDTNLIAHELIDRFGGLPQVLEAPVSELEKVEGMGENSALFLQLVTQAGRYYRKERARQVKILATLEGCAEYMLPYFFGRKVETVFLLCLDAKCKVLGCRMITEGNVNSAGISVRKIVEQALAANASSVMLAHNHPGGVAVPSSEDIQTTRQLAAALKAVDIHLIDHIVVADDDYVSLVQSGYSFGD